MTEAWIIDGVRSPRGGGKPGVGSLTHIHPQRILAQVLNSLQERVGFDTKDVEDVVMGNGSGVGDHSRSTSLWHGSTSLPATTIPPLSS